MHGLFIPAVSVLALRRGRLLTLRRSPAEEKAPGAWEVISGRIEPGEQPLEAAAREAREESGFDLRLDHRPIAAYRGEIAGSDMLVVAYRAEAPDSEPRLSEEHDAWDFVTLAEFAARCPFPRLVGVAAAAFETERAHLLVWEFRPAAGREAEFEAAYGAEGDWARLFRNDPEYLGTDLLRSAGGRYLTIDRWRSHAAFAAFRRRHGEAYAALDRRMEALTAHEAAIGTFDV
jgi:8-oxo-dGTP diphosphatase